MGLESKLTIAKTVHHWFTTSDRMVGQSGTPTHLPSSHLPSAIKSESYLDILRLRHWIFHIFTIVHLIPHLIDHPVSIRQRNGLLPVIELGSSKHPHVQAMDKSECKKGHSRMLNFIKLINKENLFNYHAFLRYELFSSLNFGPVTDRRSDRQTDGQKAMHMSPSCISKGVLKNTVG